MTGPEHARERAAVLASALLSPNRAERHGVYPRRRPRPRTVPPRAPQPTTEQRR